MKRNVFEANAEKVLERMTEIAREKGEIGVAVVANLEDKNSVQWITRMKAVDGIISDDGRFNLVAVAYSKAGEMIRTKKDSGSKDGLINGELGYQGGAIEEHDGGYILAAFSGAASEVDFSISKEALAFLCKL
jgi:hypothetical protein